MHEVKFIGRIPQTLRTWCIRNADKVEEVEYSGGYSCSDSGMAYDVWLRRGWRWRHDTVHSIIEPTIADVLRKLRDLVPCDCVECGGSSMVEPTQEQIDAEATRMASEFDKLWMQPGDAPEDPSAPRWQMHAKARVKARLWWITEGKPVDPTWRNASQTPRCPMCREPLEVIGFEPDASGGKHLTKPCQHTTVKPKNRR